MEYKLPTEEELAKAAAARISEEIIEEMEEFDALKYISHPALLEQLAEECSELAHAALKLARVLRGENPTPVTIEEAELQFIEEVVDVDICIEQAQAISISMPMEKAIYIYDERWKAKTERWKSRIKESNEE